MSLSNPKLVFVFSGKRKSGKDFLTNELIKMLPENSTVILRLSGPLKKEYADENKLDFSRLLDASEYKENFRAAMVRWGEQKRNEDPGFFCRLAINEYQGEKHPIWIVSDARRTTDLDFFQRAFPKAVRIRYYLPTSIYTLFKFFILRICTSIRNHFFGHGECIFFYCNSRHLLSNMAFYIPTLPAVFS